MERACVAARSTNDGSKRAAADATAASPPPPPTTSRRGNFPQLFLVNGESGELTFVGGFDAVELCVENASVGAAARDRHGLVTLHDVFATAKRLPTKPGAVVVPNYSNYGDDGAGAYEGRVVGEDEGVGDSKGTTEGAAPVSHFVSDDADILSNLSDDPDSSGDESL